jgi:glycosyltransferase involved in cell wall biosynthesis
MLTLHRALKTWKNKVDRFIALTQFSKSKFVEGGIPTNKIVVKPNFFPTDPGPNHRKGAYGLFVGRLSTEKGVLTLLEAWKHIRQIPLKLIGYGPLEEKVRGFVFNQKLSNVAMVGRLTQSDTIVWMQRAKFLIVPSTCFEGFPNTLVEALACGLPVITSKLGGMAEIIEDGVSGLHFQTGNPKDLAEKIRWLIDHPEECRLMGKKARQVYLEKYTAEKNYDALMNIYENTIAEYRKKN